MPHTLGTYTPFRMTSRSKRFEGRGCLTLSIAERERPTAVPHTAGTKIPLRITSICAALESRGCLIRLMSVRPEARDVRLRAGFVTSLLNPFPPPASLPTGFPDPGCTDLRLWLIPRFIPLPYSRGCGLDGGRKDWSRRNFGM